MLQKMRNGSERGKHNTETGTTSKAERKQKIGHYRFNFKNVIQ